MNNLTIGLFGTCGNSKWREPFIREFQKRDICYYNPQVNNWTPDNETQEAWHLANDDIILFPITDETYGLGSLAETGYGILHVLQSEKERSIILYIAPLPNERLKKNHEVWEESRRARALVLAHLEKIKNPNIHIASSLKHMFDLSLMVKRESFVDSTISSREEQR